jgi:hypothetical protein
MPRPPLINPSRSWNRVFTDPIYIEQCSMGVAFEVGEEIEGWTIEQMVERLLEGVF